MRVIYAADLLGWAYKIVINDETVEKVKKLQSSLKNGEKWLSTTIKFLPTGAMVAAYIAITKKRIDILISGTEGRESLLDYGDDLFEVPTIHITRRFFFELENITLNLKEDDINLIQSWLEKRARKLAENGNYN